MGAFPAILAAGVVAWLYTLGGIAQIFAALLLFALLLTPGPGGVSLLAGLVNFVTSILTGGVK